MGRFLGGEGGILSRRQLRGKFGDLKCDSLLPESILDCKSVKIAQKIPPPTGSFSTFLVCLHFVIKDAPNVFEEHVDIEYFNGIH